MRRLRLVLAVLVVGFAAVHAQTPPAAPFFPAFFKALKWRSIGP